MTRIVLFSLLPLVLFGCELDGTPTPTPTCIQEDAPEVISYLPLDDCLTALVGCDTGGEYFEDACGCGCIETEECTTPDNANVLQYQELEDCVASLVGCDAGGEYFEDACGCGCLVE